MSGNALLVISGLVLLIGGADRFVHGAAAAARNLGIAPLLIGLTVVAFATSSPEILVSVVASLRGEPLLAFGNAIGSNIVNIGLVLGCVAIVRPLKLRSATLRREMPALLAVTLLTVSLFLDSYLSRVDGLVMLTGLVIVMIWLARLGVRSAPGDPIKKETNKIRMRKLRALDAMRDAGLVDEAEDLNRCYDVTSRSVVFYASESDYIWTAERINVPE